MCHWYWVWKDSHLNQLSREYLPHLCRQALSDALRACLNRKKKKDWGPVNFLFLLELGPVNFLFLLELEHPSFPALRGHGHSWFLGLWIWNGIYTTGSSGSWVCCRWTEDLKDTNGSLSISKERVESPWCELPIEMEKISTSVTHNQPLIRKRQVSFYIGTFEHYWKTWKYHEIVDCF